MIVKCWRRRYSGYIADYEATHELIPWAWDYGQGLLTRCRNCGAEQFEGVSVTNWDLYQAAAKPWGSY